MSIASFCHDLVGVGTFAVGTRTGATDLSLCWQVVQRRRKRRWGNQEEGAWVWDPAPWRGGDGGDGIADLEGAVPPPGLGPEGAHRRESREVEGDLDACVAREGVVPDQ